MRLKNRNLSQGNTKHDVNNTDVFITPNVKLNV